MQAAKPPWTGTAQPAARLPGSSSRPRTATPASTTATALRYALSLRFPAGMWAACGAWPHSALQGRVPGPLACSLSCVSPWIHALVPDTPLPPPDLMPDTWPAMGPAPPELPLRTAALPGPLRAALAVAAGGGSGPDDCSAATHLLPMWAFRCPPPPPPPAVGCLRSTWASCAAYAPLLAWHSKH